MNNSITPQAITALCARGVHFVLCDGKKGKPGWKEKTPLSRILSHVRRRGSLGFIPGRSGLWVLDVDKFPGEDKDTGDLLASVSALATVDTPHGRHAYFKKPSTAPIKNREWGVGGYSGDVRGDNGYCVLWEPHKLAEALDLLPSATPTAVHLFPKQAKATGARPVEGDRNNTLNADVFKAAQRGETKFTRQRAAALAAGLDPFEADATIKSASEAGAASTFPRKDATALEGALAALGITVRYNLRAMRAEVSNGRPRNLGKN